MIDDDSSTRAGADEPEEDKKGSFWRELPVLLAIAVVVALVVRTFALQSFWIPSGSMENTLQRGDRVLVNKLIYDFREPERGEVIVFKAPQSWRGEPGDEDFIKRVIAVGGDTVSYDAGDGQIAVNGEPLDESSYIYTDPTTGEQDLASKDGYEFSVTVPKGRLWVMGDHRGSSGDSRENYIRGGEDVQRATIPVDSVVGKAFLLMWPVAHWKWLSVPDTYSGIPPPKASELSGSCQAGRVRHPRKLFA
nr:signal peptidase I [Stackebrandtia nassauensis]